MSDTELDNESTESGSQLMSEDSTDLLIDALEIQVQELMNENQTLKKKVEELEARIKVLQIMSDSEIINNVFSYL